MWFSNFLLQLKNERSGSTTLLLFYYFNFESKRGHAFSWSKMSNLIRMRHNQNGKFLITSREMNLMCFSSYKSRELVKVWRVKKKVRVGARERKKSPFLVKFILSEGHFVKICVLSQYIVYWINFHNIHTFTYQKALLHTLLLLVFKMV